jgi:hypothetical protein
MPYKGSCLQRLAGRLFKGVMQHAWWHFRCCRSQGGLTA